MNKFFIDYAWSIFEVAKNKHIDMSEAFSSFKADVIFGVNDNTQLEGVDFTNLKTRWELLDGGAQGEAVDSWNDFYPKNFKELTAAWNAGDRAAFQDIIDNA